MSLSLKPSHLSVYKEIAILILKYGRKAGIQEDTVISTFELDGDVEPSDDAEAFVNDLEKLGPTFIKLGQLLSTRPDLLPADWLVALQRLQDNVEAFSYDQVQEIVEEGLGGRISKLFDFFDEEPLATASLGQVHRARLRGSETEVAVKVQRPNIRKQVLNELDALSEIATFLDEKTDLGRQYEPGRIVTQFRASILKELNYQEEASNLSRLRKNLAGVSEIFVPKPFRDYCSERVLTMEFVSGTKITDLSGVVHTDLNGPTLAEGLFKAYLKQVLVDGFFHADPHPGNLLLTKDRRLALLDLGMVGTIPERLKGLLLQLLSAVADGRSSDAAEATLRIGRPKEDFDQESCTDEIIRIVESRRGAQVSDMQVGQLVLEVTQACAKNGLRIPNEIFMLGKMLLNLDLIAKSLDPQFNPDEAIRAESSELAQAHLKSELTAGNFLHLLTDVKDLISKTPAHFNDFFSKLSGNKVKLKVDTINEHLWLKAIQKVANRITAGLIISAMIIGAAMLMNIESGFTLFGYPGLAIILFLLAAFAGIFLVGNILLGEVEARKEDKS